MNRAAESISSSSEPQFPPEPKSLEDTGLAESTVEHLILNTLYFRGDIFGQDLSTAVGLRFSVIQNVLESLKLRYLIQIKRSLGVSGVGSLFALTDAGRSQARDGLETNQYIGPAPVPLAQYTEQVRSQRPADGWLTKAALEKALSGMVITKQALAQVGPAVSSCKSLLVYGKPGDGKTFLIESLNNLESTPVFVPYAIECQGNIIQVFDPIYHQCIEKEIEPSVLAISKESSYDRRWAKCKRPFIVSGGELSLDMLDLRFNANSKIYEAPFQLKANSGIYLIDDFGRQRATPAEVLNRWIVPMERRIDYLSFMTGGKMTVPFETFLVFSTNLNPADIGDEAFLRRIQYKMLLRGPSVGEFSKIFQSFCTAKSLPCLPGLVDRFVEKRYKKTGKPFRRCHPRDVLTHALNLIHFERLPHELNHELLDRAYESCFVQEHDEVADDIVVVTEPVQPCEDFWSRQALAIPAALGRMAFAAGFRDRATAQYSSPTPGDYDQAETCRVLQKIHSAAFREWLNRTMEHQAHDLADYLSTPAGRTAYLTFGQRELVGLLVPADAQPHERQLFQTDFTTVLSAVSQQRPVYDVPATLVEMIA
jgi:predicted ATPase with chaperone activity